MALPALTFNVLDYPSGKDSTASKIGVFGSLTIAAGGLYQTNGLPLSFAGAEFEPISVDNAVPVWASFYSPASGYLYFYDPVHQSLRIFENAGAAGPLAELANGASVAADTAYFQAMFNKS